MHARADPLASARDRAFERLYRRYVKDIYRYTLALLRNPADAEDATQTTFLNAYRAYQRGEEPLKPQNWLITIAHNACRTRYARAARRPQEVPIEDRLHELSVPSDEIPNVREVLDALAELPFNQRAALVMRELEGRSYAEIAVALDVSVPAVETLIFRARRALRIRRSALETLVALPLPPSLSAFSNGGAAIGGGALVGSGVLLKAAVAVSVGVVAGGVGTKVSAEIGATRGADAVPRAQAADAGSILAVAGGPASARAAVVSTARTGRDAARGGTDALGRRAPRALDRHGRSPAPSPGVEQPAAAVSAPSHASTPPAGAVPTPESVVDAVGGALPAPDMPVPPVSVPDVPPVPALPPPPVEVPVLPPPPPLPPPPALP